MKRNAKRITLDVNDSARACCERTPRYDVMFDGKIFFQLYFNMRGYVGYLPAPHPDKPGETINLEIGEKGISAYKKEIALLNKEWAKLERLEYLRTELQAERISWGELHELQSLAEYINPADVELLEAAGLLEEVPAS